MREPIRRPRVIMKFWTRFNKLSEAEGEVIKKRFHIVLLIYALMTLYSSP